MPEFQTPEKPGRAWNWWKECFSVLQVFLQKSIPRVLLSARSKHAVVDQQADKGMPSGERTEHAPTDDMPPVVRTDIAQIDQQKTTEAHSTRKSPDATEEAIAEAVAGEDISQESMPVPDAAVLTDEAREAATLAEGDREAGGIQVSEVGELSPVPETRKDPVEQRKYPSLYDRALDPPDYEQEADRHPHIKAHAPAEQLLIGPLAYGWQIVGASRRGFGHAYDGGYREDDFAICSIPGDLSGDEKEVVAVLVAIADGVGSKMYARYGALAAVEGAISNFSYPPRQQRIGALAVQLREVLDYEDVRQRGDEQVAAFSPSEGERGQDNPSAILEQCEATACSLLSLAMEDALVNVLTVAEEKQLPVSDLHSTLLVFLAIPLRQDCLFVASTQVGDGALFLRQQGETYSDYWEHLQRAQIHGAGNEVLPLLCSNQALWEEYFRCGLYKNALFLMGMTDGTANDIEPPFPTPEMPDPDPYIFVESFYSYIKRSLDAHGEDERGLALSTALEYRKMRSYDDRTLICMYRNEEKDRQQ